MSGSSGAELKEKTRKLSIAPSSRYAVLQRLIIDGFFDLPVSTESILQLVREKFGKRWKSSYVQTYMVRFLKEGIIHAVKAASGHKNFWVISSVTREDALRQVGKGNKFREIEENLFSDDLLHRLEKDFGAEVLELRSNFGRNPISTAFLLRKILEKLIIIVLGKNGKQSLLEDKNHAGRWVGLDQMIDIASREKLNGIPFLTARTAKEIKGIKFLGDTAAHNPLASVDISTVVPQMPFIVTAYRELAGRL